jgi:hypothetical protein
VAPSHPLRELYIDLPNPTPQLVTAVGASTTLESVSLGDRVPMNVKQQFASILKSVRTLRQIRLRHFPIDAGVELLKSRTNWRCIGLPLTAEDRAKASACAPLNCAAFELFSDPKTPEALNAWLFNPNLTRLETLCEDLPITAFEALRHCSNLRRLVTANLPFLSLFCTSRCALDR